MIASDPSGTSRRIAHLRTYLGDTVLTDDGRFICQHSLDCRRSHQMKTPGGVFYEGQLHHVGNHYDLSIHGRPFRVAVVAQEYGHNPIHCDMETRHHMVWAVTGIDRRFHKLPSREHRNPHMRGTTSLLRLVFGLGLGADHHGEFLQLGGDRVHIFDAFSLVNCLLCSAVEPGQPAPSVKYAPETVTGGSTGASTSVMRRNCSFHLRRSLEILCPDLIVAQGVGVYSWILKGGVVTEMPPALLVSRADNRGKLTWVSIGSHKALLAGFTHPSAHGNLGWGANDHQPYLVATVKPTIEQARRVLLGS